MNNTRMQKKQYRLSLCLKAVIIAMIGLLIAFFGVITYYTHNDVILTASLFAQNCKSYGPFIYITAILSLIILIFFWQVATEIGRGNSFSLENVKHFRKMGIIGILLSLEYVFRAIYLLSTATATYLLSTATATAMRIGYCIALMIAGILFMAVCFILSSLIQNAYEMQQENDLTI